jgi:hypothetical protein
MIHTYPVDALHPVSSVSALMDEVDIKTRCALDTHATARTLGCCGHTASSCFISGNFDTVGQLGHLLSTYRLMILFAFSLPSFAGGIAGITSALPLGFQGGFTSGCLGDLRCG